MASLRKGIDLLFLFSEAEPALSLHEIATRLDFPRSSAYRFVSTLRQTGLLVQDRPPAATTWVRASSGSSRPSRGRWTSARSCFRSCANWWSVRARRLTSRSVEATRA